MCLAKLRFTLLVLLLLTHCGHEGQRSGFPWRLLMWLGILFLASPVLPLLGDRPAQEPRALWGQCSTDSM